MQSFIYEVAGDKYGAAALGVLGLIGAAKVVCKTLGALSFIKRNYLRSEFNFLKRYGKTDSWVVITGGSDGIGLEICEQMAEKGFNICIIGRSQNKIDEVMADLLKKFPKIKTKVVIADFAELSTI